MRLARPAIIIVAAMTVVFAAGACGGGGKGDRDRQTTATTESSASTTADATPSDATTDILGESTQFDPGGDGAEDLSSKINGRECVLEGQLFGSCRAATGAGGEFVLTAEGNRDNSSEWNVVVRCGLDPAVPVASARGEFQPITADLGLAAYGEMFGVTLGTAREAEFALVYLPSDAPCPVVWGLGAIKPSTLVTGGLDALNGTERPIQFLRPDGVTACVTADDAGGLAVVDHAEGGCPSEG